MRLLIFLQLFLQNFYVIFTLVIHTCKLPVIDKDSAEVHSHVSLFLYTPRVKHSHSLRLWILRSCCDVFGIPYYET